VEDAWADPEGRMAIQRLFSKLSSGSILSSLSGVNYFFGLTTTISPINDNYSVARRPGAKPRDLPGFLIFTKMSSRRRSCGMWESRSDFPRAWEGWKTRFWFSKLHGTVISTALRFPWLSAYVLAFRLLILLRVSTR